MDRGDAFFRVRYAV